MSEISFKGAIFFRAVGPTKIPDPISVSFFAPAEEDWDFVLWSADKLLKIDWLNFCVDCCTSGLPLCHFLFLSHNHFFISFQVFHVRLMVRRGM